MWASQSRAGRAAERKIHIVTEILVAFTPPMGKSDPKYALEINGTSIAVVNVRRVTNALNTWHIPIYDIRVVPFEITKENSNVGLKSLWLVRG